MTSAFLAGEFHEYGAAIDISMVDVLSISIGAWGDQTFSYRGAVQDLGEWHRRFTHIDRFIHVQASDDLTQAQQQHTRATRTTLCFLRCVTPAATSVSAQFRRFWRRVHSTRQSPPWPTTSSMPWRVTQQLLAAVHDEQTIAGVLGANFRRFYRRVEAATG